MPATRSSLTTLFTLGILDDVLADRLLQRLGRYLAGEQHLAVVAGGVDVGVGGGLVVAARAPSTRCSRPPRTRRWCGGPRAMSDGGAGAGDGRGRRSPDRIAAATARAEKANRRCRIMFMAWLRGAACRSSRTGNAVRRCALPGRAAVLWCGDVQEDVTVAELRLAMVPPSRPVKATTLMPGRGRLDRLHDILRIARGRDREQHVVRVAERLEPASQTSGCSR